MRYLIRIISATITLTLFIASCENATTNTKNDSFGKEKCCKGKEVCKNKPDTTNQKTIAPDCQKACCAKEDVKKCCTLDNTSIENRNDSETFTETKGKLESNKVDSTTLKICVSDCDKECSSDDIKKDCNTKCNLYCSSNK